MKKLGELVKILIKEKGMSKRDFCLSIGINENSLNYKVKSGTFTIEETFRIMELFNLDLNTVKNIIDYKPLQEVKFS